MEELYPLYSEIKECGKRYFEFDRDAESPIHDVTFMQLLKINDKTYCKDFSSAWWEGYNEAMDNYFGYITDEENR